MTTTTVAPVLTPEEKVKSAKLTMDFARQSTGFHFGLPEEMEKDNNIVVAKNGIFRVVRTPVANLTTQIAKMETGYTVPGLLEMEQGVELKVPKIPFKYWLQCLAWYKDVHKKDQTEASVLFFWNTNEITIPPTFQDGEPIKGITIDGQLIVYVPEQKNQGGLSEFHDDAMVDWLRLNTTPLLETHSHHNMDAYFSGTDDANENANQFYAVFGKINDKEPKFAFRFCSGNHKVITVPWVLFEAPRIVTVTQIQLGDMIIDLEQQVQFAGPWPAIAYPEDWMGQHRKSYAATTYNNTEWCEVLRKMVPKGTAQKKTWEREHQSGSTAQHTKTTSDTVAGEITGTDGKKKFVIETETSVVELVSPSNIVSKFTKDTIAKLVTSLSNAGYDEYIYEGIIEGMYDRV